MASLSGLGLAGVSAELRQGAVGGLGAAPGSREARTERSQAVLTGIDGGAACSRYGTQSLTLLVEPKVTGG